MNTAQYENLRAWAKEYRQRASEVQARYLRSGGDRTLLYGYLCSRHTFHVYMEGGRIHRIVYGADVVEYDAKDVWDAKELVPDKRAYPERTDMSFCEELVKAGVEVTFTAYSEGHFSPAARFHGLRVQDFR